MRATDLAPTTPLYLVLDAYTNAVSKPAEERALKHTSEIWTLAGVARLSIIFVVLFLGGCATADFNYRAESIDVSEPPIGTTSTAYVGDVLLRQGTYAEHDAILVREKIDVGWSYDLLPGYYLKHGEDGSKETYLPSGGKETGSVKKSALSDPWTAILAYKTEPKICVLTAFNVNACTKSTMFTRTKVSSLDSNSFQQTLIYSGRIGDKINIGYREFSNDLARPAFNNDVEYDLSGSSSVIGYKGARLEILEATNELIRYRVISNFNAALK